VLVNYTGGNAGQASVGGSIVNSNAITGTAARLCRNHARGGSVSQNVTNALGGTITAKGGVGIPPDVNAISFSRSHAGPSTVGGSITQSGHESHRSGPASRYRAAQHVTGGITNSGNITGSTSASTSAARRGDDDQSASRQIGGAILLSSLGDTVNVTGGIINRQYYRYQAPAARSILPSAAATLSPTLTPSPA